MVIGFCTSCMNRLWQLKQTLPVNLALLRGTEHFLALCNYGSTDGLHEFVREHFAGDVTSGNLVYFHTEAPQRFHASRAKNTAHRLGLTRRPEVLFNLDADNFLTDGTLTALTGLFGQGQHATLHQWSRQWTDGTFGRIGLRATDWQKLGGYDESLQEMAWQDIDLLSRTRALELSYHLQSDGIRPAVQNTITQKLANLGARPASEHAAMAQFRELHLENMVRSFGRPLLLPVEGQLRYEGTLNFSAWAQV